MAQIFNFPVSESVVENDMPNTHTTGSDGGNGGGGDMLTRIVKLESDVGHIKDNTLFVRDQMLKVSSDASDAKRDTAVLLQKSVDFDASLSKKPSTDYFDAKFASMETKISDVKVWVLGIFLLSIAIPIITFLLNLYLKKA